MPPQKWEGDDAVPGGWKNFTELAWNLARLVRGYGLRGPRGPVDGQPVLVIPGFLCSDGTTLVLRKMLARAGFRVHGWKLGWNTGVKADTLDKIKARIDGLGHGQPVVIVGWSLGGLYGREFARAYPDKVKAVITLSSPFSGDPKQNNVWQLYEKVAKHKVDDPPIARITDKPPVPTLALWSRRDGLIAPRSQRGLEHERDKAVEVNCQHMAYGVSRRAARQVVRELKNFLAEIDNGQSRPGSNRRKSGKN